MDGYSIAFGLGGLIVGAIGGVTGVLGVLFARNALDFEKEKWEESNSPNIEVQQPSLLGLSESITLVAVNKGIPAVILREVGFWLDDARDMIHLTPREHQILNLPVQLERWEKHIIQIHSSLMASILRDDCGYNGSVVLAGFFMDTLDNIYLSMNSSILDIDKWYVEPPTDEELEGGDKSSRSLWGTSTSALSKLAESRKNQS